MEQRSSDFRNYLQEELVLRCRKNPAYSLRSFAKSLDLSPSFLSKILNGKRRITDEIFKKVSTHLNLEPEQMNSFKNFVGATKGELDFHGLQLEYFKLISDWFHYAILELTHVQDFKNDAEWIGARLGITANQAKGAIERLIHLELLEEINGQLRVTSGGNTTTKNEFTALAFKKMQDELLSKARQSLWNEDISQRDHTSICMAIHTEDIPEVKKRLTQVRRDLCEYLERPRKTKPDDVYNLSLSFFSLTKESP